MDNYGTSFQLLRKGKHLTLNQLSDNIISPQQLSKFERNIHSITVPVFIELLERMNVSINEFMVYHNQQAQFSQGKFLSQLEAAIAEKKGQTMKDLIFQEKNLYNRDKNIRHLHNINILQQNILKMKNQPVNQELSKEISDYLFDCEDWAFYELCLFNNYLEFLSISFIENLIKDASIKAKKFSRLLLNQNIETVLYCNVIFHLLEIDKLNIVPNLISLAKKNLTNTVFFFDMNRLNFLEGIYLIKIGNTAIGKRKCAKALSIFEHFDTKYYFQSHRQDLIDFFGSDFSLED
ncbi:helix-turn-helix domain-containing protein [Facklamia sp. DSM 111018]|uniref:Helix-turn-helix domain-containing protein n=1 Tax=Facklamia lactis TaxID=2749967 RepID=A0ABS0LR58_9LACT|nr:Rgg/GadR/MutR family transcriptional regulator [Facklamia lactis]MBG9980998.1 helix-turn-helix domain-containing protein [Facklamia lactis]MBG9986639.1 helix-turn-helix domain-containing protein [Facklamia lactis]